MRLVGHLTRPWNSPHYGGWVNCNFVTIYCFLPLLLIFVIKFYVSNCIALCLATLVVICFLHLYACFNCLSVHASSLHPLLAQHHLCYIDVYCVCTIKQLFYVLFYVYYSPPFIYCFGKHFRHHVATAYSVFVWTLCLIPIIQFDGLFLCHSLFKVFFTEKRLNENKQLSVSS